MVGQGMLALFIIKACTVKKKKGKKKKDDAVRQLCLEKLEVYPSFPMAKGLYKKTCTSLPLLQVDPADVSQQVAKIEEAAQSYTKADGEIVKLMLQKPALLLPKKCYMISALIKVTPQDAFCL